ncbi:MAG: hypothetical protein U0169_27615 [Polyangiaceae bacterium]
MPIVTAALFVGAMIAWLVAAGSALAMVQHRAEGVSVLYLATHRAPAGANGGTLVRPSRERAVAHVGTVESPEKPASLVRQRPVGPMAFPLQSGRP